MADINEIKTDTAKEVEGVWVDFAVGIKLKIARARNPKYNELIRDMTEDIRIELRRDTVTKDKFEDILLQVRAKTILLDWKNIEENGVTVPYSVEKAIKFFRNPELKDFYKFIIAVSENADRYAKILVEDSAKN